jgi:hypothetical protein
MGRLSQLQSIAISPWPVKVLDEPFWSDLKRIVYSKNGCQSNWPPSLNLLPVTSREFETDQVFLAPNAAFGFVGPKRGGILLACAIFGIDFPIFNYRPSSLFQSPAIAETASCRIREQKSQLSSIRVLSCHVQFVKCKRCRDLCVELGTLASIPALFAIFECAAQSAHRCHLPFN